MEHIEHGSWHMVGTKHRAAAISIMADAQGGWAECAD